MITLFILLSIVSLGLFVWLILEVVKLRKGLDLLNKKTSAQKDPINVDEIYKDVKEFIKTADRVSASILQRRFRVGYARAAQLLDMLEEDGLVGQADDNYLRWVIHGPKKLVAMISTEGKSK